MKPAVDDIHCAGCLVKERRVAKLKRENEHLAKVISNVWDALNEEGITISGARGQMLADALLTAEEQE